MEVSIVIKLDNIEKCDGCPMVALDCSQIYCCHISNFSGATWLEDDFKNITRPQSCIEKFGR